MTLPICHSKSSGTHATLKACRASELDLATRRLLKSLRNVFRHLGLLHSVQWNQVGTPAFYMGSGFMANFTPDTIFETELVQTTCTVELDFDFENEIRHLDETYNASYLLEIAEQLPFADIIGLLENNHVIYQDCISNYSHFLNNLKTWFDSFALQEVGEINSGFIFDVNAVEVLNDNEWFTETIIEKYKSAELSKLDLANIIDAEKVALITTNIEAFRNALKDKFSKRLFGIIDTVQSNYEAIYNQSLEFLDTFQLYFATQQTRYWNRGREMSVWRIPAARVLGTDLVEYQIGADEIWKTWPQYMNVDSFAKDQMKNVFSEITRDFFDEVNNAIHAVDDVLLGFATDVKKDLNALSESLQLYKQSTLVDETFIL